MLSWLQSQYGNEAASKFSSSDEAGDSSQSEGDARKELRSIKAAAGTEDATTIVQEIMASKAQKKKTQLRVANAEKQKKAREEKKKQEAARRRAAANGNDGEGA